MPGEEGDSEAEKEDAPSVRNLLSEELLGLGAIVFALFIWEQNWLVACVIGAFGIGILSVSLGIE